MKVRSATGADLHCRLGGTDDPYSPYGDVIRGDVPAEKQVLAAVLGVAAPPKISSLFGPGCTVGTSGSFK